MARRRTARQTTDDNIIRQIRFACWIIKVIYPQSEYVTLMAFYGKRVLNDTFTVISPVLLGSLLSVCVPHFRFISNASNFRGILCSHCADGGHRIALPSNFLQQIIPNERDAQSLEALVTPAHILSVLMLCACQ